MHQPWVGFEAKSLQSHISVPSFQAPAQQLIILLQYIATATGLLQKKMNHASSIDSVDLVCINYKGVWAEWVMEMPAFSQHYFWRDDTECLALPWAAKQPQQQKIAECWRAAQVKGDGKGGGCREIFVSSVSHGCSFTGTHKTKGVSLTDGKEVDAGGGCRQICSIFWDAIKMASAKSLQL